MFSIKLFKFDSNDYFFIQADSLDDLKKKASVKLEKKVEKLIRHEDFIEIDEEDVFQELVKICDNSKREYLTLIAIDDKSHLDTRLINSETNRILNEIKSNKSRVRELQVVLEEDENTEHTNENNQKLENLKKEYNKLIFETIATKTYDQKDIQKLENKLNLLKNKQNDLNELFSRLRFTEKVDFCFLIDCTSSMSTYIEQVHDSINDIIDQIYSKYGRIQIRFSYVGYRDFSELDNRILSVPFLEDIELFKTFLGEIITYGGEDECEDVFGGLLEATKLDWSSPVRILFHLCDAPCHGLRFHTNCEDLYPKGDPLGLEIKNLLSSLHKLNINYYFAQISPTTLKMIEEFNKELPQFQIKSLKLSKNMTGLVAQTIQESILKTTRLNGSNNVIKVRELNAPDWSSLKGFKKYNADYFTAVYLKNFEQIRECLTFEKHNPVVWIGENPFSQGVLRYAYQCVVDMGDIDNECYLNCVIKESVYSNPEFNTRKFHEDNIQVQLIASFLAHKFTQLNSEFKIRFLEVDLIRVHETGVYYSIEEFSEGEFKKWMNNEGNLNQEENVDVLCAFSHWTYQATDEYLMITDLQGFSFKDKEFILTDPAIICSSEPNRFGKTNLGMNSPFRPTKTSPNGSNHTNGFDFTNYLNPLISNPNLFPSIFTDPNSFNQHLIANLASSLFLQQQNCWSKFLTDLALAQTTTTSSPSIYKPEIPKNDVKKPKNSFSINDLINCDDTKKETTDETPLNLTTTSSRELNTQLSCFISNQDKQLKPKIPEVKFESYNKNIGLIEEKMKQPLRFNFKRETIVKELTSNGVKGDVIYYSPCGKKLRNFQEIERYLYKFYTERNQKTGSVLLNKDNFTFSSKYIVGNYLILKETPSNNKFITQNNPINHNTIKDLKYDTFNEKKIRSKLTELYPEFRRSLCDAKSEFMSSETDLLSIKSESEIIEEKCVEKDENNFQIEKLNFNKDPRFVNIDPKKTEKYLQREKKTRQRWFDYILAQYVDKQFNTENSHESYSRVLDVQIEDMQQKYLKKIPDFENLNEKLNHDNLSWLGDTLQIIEFLKNFSTQILQSINLIDDQYQVDLSPLTNSINNFYSSLKSYKFKKELFEFVQILIKILLYNQEDEFIEEFKDDESFLITNIKHFEVNESSFSEILRLYFVKSLKTLESHRISLRFNLDITHNLVLKLENFISELNVKNFEFLNIETKASMISHLCDDLLQNSTFMQMGYNELEPKSSNLIIEYIDENIEKINKLKQDKIHVKKNDKKLGKKLSSLNTEILECQKVLRSGLNLGQDRFKRSYWKLSESKEILIESNFDENIIEKKSFDEEIVNCMDDLVSQIEFKNLEENIVSKFSHLVELKQEPFSLKLNQEHPDLLNLTFENIQILIKNSIEYSTRENIDCNYLSEEKCSSSKWWIMNVDNNKCSVLNTLSKRGFREKILSKNLELLEKNDNCSKKIFFENFSNCPNFSTEKLIRKDKIKIIKLISNLETKVLSANLQMANRDLTQMGNSKETETSDEEDTEDPIHKARSKLLNLENSIDKRYLKYPFSFKKKLANYKIRLSNEIDRDFIDRVLDDMEDKDCNLSIKLNENICEFMKEVDVKSSEDLVGEDYEISVELLRWRRLVTKAQTTSQLSIYLDELNKLIEWDKSIMKASCHICNMDDNEEKLLLCDNCDLGYHTYCFKPKIDKIPSGDWYCFKCISKFLNIKHMCYVCGRDNLTHKADDYENKSSRKNINQNSLNKCEKCLVVFHTKCLPEAKFFKTTLKWHCLNCQTNKTKLVKNDSETSDLSIQYKDTELEKPLPKKKGRKRKYPLPETNEVKQNEIETETKKVKEDAESKNDEIEEDDSMKKFKTFSEKLTQKKLKQQNELDLYKCRALLNEIIRSKFASHFMEKVSEKDYPDYYEAIKEPIDLTTIKDKLRNKKYENKEQFAYDCRLIFDNCEYFNEDDSLIGQAGHKLRALFETKWLKVFD